MNTVPDYIKYIDGNSLTANSVRKNAETSRNLKNSKSWKIFTSGVQKLKNKIVPLIQQRNNPKVEVTNPSPEMLTVRQ
jgi:hypothetical protein